MSAESAESPRRYPPVEHMLSDMQIGFLAEEGRPVVAPISPELLNDAGSARIGALGVVVDVMAGGFAIRSVLPDWAVTSDLSVQALRPIGSGEVEGHGRVLRAGKNTIVIDVDLLDRASRECVAASTLTFTRIPSRTAAPDIGAESEAAFSFGEPHQRLSGRLFDALGIAVGVDGEVEIPVVPYVQNSVGALQGGAVLCVGEAAAEARARAETGEPLVVSDLSVHYLAMVKVGPIASRTRLLRVRDGEVLARVELVDRGHGDRLLSVLSARVTRPL